MMAAGTPAWRPLVLDSNIVLDWLVFADPRVLALQQALHNTSRPWLQTAEMREELRRVLDYPHLAARLGQQGRCAAELLAQVAQRAQLVPAATKAPVTCKDPDDQKFIDLAVAHQAELLSKDKAVLCMARRLLRLGVLVAPVFQPSS